MKSYFRRPLSMLLCLCMMVSIIPAFTPVKTSAASDILYGDADDDRDVDLQDILLIEKHIAGEPEITINFTNADVNADDLLDEEDVRLIKAYLTGNLNSLTPELCTITFDTAGGSAVAPMTIGKGFFIRREIPSPAKDEHIFTGWVQENGDTFFQQDAVTADTKLIATYKETELSETLQIDSFALTDQKPDVTFLIKGDYATADEVKANLTLITSDGSDPVEADVTRKNGDTFIVKANDGFRAGGSYSLTLGEGLSFAEKDATLKTAVFTIKNAEYDRIYYNENLLFIKDTEEMTYTLENEAEPRDVLDSALLNNETGNEPVKGTFYMGTINALQVNTLICIYETTDPRQRDYTQNDYEDDSLAYIKITAVNGNIYSFESLGNGDAGDVLLMPDSIPFRVGTLPAAGNGTVNKNDYDAAARVKLGFTEAPEYKSGDFLIFYTEEFEKADENTPVCYAQVKQTQGDTVFYETVTKDFIDSFMGMFVRTDVEGEEILDGLDQQAILSNVKAQAENSGFIEQASDHMLQSAVKTETLKNTLLENGFNQNEIDLLAAGKGDERLQLEIEGIVVTPAFISGDRFNNSIGIALYVRIVLSLSKKVSPTSPQKSALKIELSASFIQEIAVSVDVSVEDRWQWYLFVPILKELSCYTSIDIKNYSYVSVGARIYTVNEGLTPKWKALSDSTASPKVQEALRDLNKLGAQLKKAQAKKQQAEELLGKIGDIRESLPRVVVGGKEYSVKDLEDELGLQDVSSEFENVLSSGSEDEFKVGLDQLMDRYAEMLESECEWVELYNKQIIEKIIKIKIVEIKLTVNFVIRTQINITLGADVEYQVGKRYNFWVHIIGRSSGSSELDLLDERFGFQFYIMGMLGLKIGIKAEIAVGLISTQLGSVGASIEFGPYLKLWGYFFYVYTRLRPANTSTWNVNEERMGAMYLEFGLYLIVKFKAQAFMNTFKYEPTLFSGEFPLLSAGVNKNVYDFANEPQEDDILYIKDSDGDSSNGIKMTIPSNYRLMKNLNLCTGERLQEVYEGAKFYYRVTNSRFSVDQNGVLSVAPPSGTRYMESDLIITWKVDKLAFSSFDITITVPVIWTNMSASELSERFTASVAVGNPADGYDIVWSRRCSRLNVFDLPDKEEILEMINYYSYSYSGINLKYSDDGDYRAENTRELSITSDMIYYFDITKREYTLNVHGVQNSNGSLQTRTYKTTYGKPFDLSDLQGTGTNNHQTNEYTAFFDLTTRENEPDVFDFNTTVSMAFLERFGDSVIDVNANYLDISLKANYIFLGIAAPEVSVKFKSGTIPYFEDLNDHIEKYGGEGAFITDIDPIVTEMNYSVTYTVTCKESEGDPPAKYTLSFETNGGNTIKSQKYQAGSLIYRPSDPERTGYTFAGWYSDPGFNSSFSFDIMPEENITVYGRWTANKYTVNFLSNNILIETRDVSYGSVYGDLPIPVKQADFKFTGWYTQADEGEKIEADTGFEQTTSQTLYARWEEKMTIDTDLLTYSSGQGGVYNESAFSFVFSSPAYLPVNSFKIWYKWQGGDIDEDWTTEPPVQGGTYDVKLTRETDENYKKMEELFIEAALTVNRATYTLEQPVGYAQLSYSFPYDLIDSVWFSRPNTKSAGKITYVCLLYYNNEIYDYRSVNFQIINLSDLKRPGVFVECYGFVTVNGDRNYEAWNSDRFFLPQAHENPYTKTNGLNFAEEGSYTLASSPLALSGKALVKNDVSTGTLANGPFVLSAEDVAATRGQTFEIPVRIDGNPSLWGVLANIKYDPDAFELVDYTFGDVFREDAFTLQKDLNKDHFTFLATRGSLDNTSEDGELLTLTFKVKPQAKDQTYTLNVAMIQSIDAGGAVKSAAIENGSVIVDDIAPVIAGIEDGKTYCGEQTVTVIEDNLDKVAVNGVEITLQNGSFILRPANGTQTVSVTDKSGNSTSISVTVNDGHSYKGGKCVICGKTDPDYNSGYNPDTGDNSNPFIPLTSMAILMCGIILTIKRRKRGIVKNQ